jgi:hypothetical protein
MDQLTSISIEPDGNVGVCNECSSGNADRDINAADIHKGV